MDNVWFSSLFISQNQESFYFKAEIFFIGMKNQKKNRKERRKEILAEILNQQSR